MTGILASFLPDLAAVDPWWFLAVGSLSAIIFGMGKVGFGGGVGVLAVPVMIIACDDARIAVALMLPLLIATDWIGIVIWWRKWELRSLLHLAPGTLLGIAAGGACLWFFSDTATGGAVLMLSVGLIAAAFVILEALKRYFRAEWTFRPVLWQGTIAGILLGVSSTLAHAAGPVATMYLLSQRMKKDRYVATMVFCFWAVNHVKLIPYGLAGMIDTDYILPGLWLIPAVIAGAFAGRILNRRLGERQFTGIVYILLAAAAVHLIYKSIISL